MARIEIYNSVSGSSFWRRFEQELRAAGHDVHNHSVLTSEDYRRPRGPAGRAWVRWQLYGGFGVKVLWSVLWTTVRDTQPRLHIVTTNPFFMPAFVALLTGWRGDRTICLLFDVYPDALMAAGWTASQSWAARSVGWITRLTLKRCTATVFLGDKIRHHVEAKYGAARRGAVIAVGANGAEFRDRPPRREAAGGTVSVLYSGLLGRMHEVDTLIEALRQAPPAGVTVRFHASGQNYARLRASVPPEHAQLLGPLEEKAWENAQLQAEVGLITLSADGASVAMPSKTYSALVAGQAIIAVCPEDSDLAELVRTHDCGWIVAPGDAAGLRRALEEAATKPDLLYARRCRAFAAGHTHYDMRPVVAHWLDLLGGLARAPDATAEKALREAQRVAGIPAKSGPRRLIIVGAGGFGSKVLATVNTINASLTEPVWQVVGFVDEDASRVGLNWDGCPIIGTPSSLPGVWGKGASFALAIGDNAVRLRIATQMEEAGFAPATIVHPSSVVAENAVLGRGVYIDGLAVIAANARIGDYALINMQAGIGHHAVLGAFCQICPGGRIGGYANLGEGSFIGTNAAVLPGKRVGARAVVGAVSMVADDVNDRESVMGIPARRFLRRGAAKSDGAAETINLLISSAGRRAELINCFRAGAARLGVRLNIIATDADTLASSACHLADKAIPVPPVRDRAFFERL
jgi:UDP-perosamine 4-acetyltransferase